LEEKKMSSSSWIGRKLSDRYEIEELLGQGGMSSVYKAYDHNLRRTVAVKMIHPHLSTDPNFISRFEEEAASVAQLRNPNIIQVYDFANEDDTYYMVLEFVPGESMGDHLERLQKSNRRMETNDAIKYIANICDALEYAHNRGLIHRDIKPANIMLDVQGQAILMDFGIAKIIGGKQHTATGAVVGTALYMSPEVIQGEQADNRVDIYALGVTLFEILAGQPPYRADSAMTVLMMHVNDPIPDLRKINQDVPAEMVEIVKKALAKDKRNRYQSASEFAQALRRFDSSTSTSGPGGGTTIESISKGTDSTMVEEQPEPSAFGGTLIEEPVSTPPEKVTTIDSAPAEESGDSLGGRIPPPPGPATSSSGGRKGGIPLPVLIGGGLVGVIILVVGIIFGSRAFRPTDLDATGTVAATATIAPSATVEIPTNTPPPTATMEPTFTPTATNPAGPYVRINSIRIENGVYLVDYETFGYTEILPGVHIHFYFNNIAPEQAGSGGSGPWYLWGGPRPFDGYKTSDRPADATQMCALQANANHTINLETGNCLDLPSE
jgi:serine/threonine protein kinase